MSLFQHDEVVGSEGYEIRVVGGLPFNLRDLYHLLLRVPWWAALAFIVAAYLAMNALFAVCGFDDVSGQPVHAQRTWQAAAFAWGARLADVLSELPDGNLLLDLRRFHEVTPTPPSAAFPYGTTTPA